MILKQNNSLQFETANNKIITRSPIVVFINGLRIDKFMRRNKNIVINSVVSFVPKICRTTLTVQLNV